MDTEDLKKGKNAPKDILDKFDDDQFLLDKSDTDQYLLNYSAASF